MANQTDDTCFGCDEGNCNYTDVLGFAWHWHCFTADRSWNSEEEING